MAKVIEFYVPDRYKRKVKWIPTELRGKVIEFTVPIRKSA